MNQSISNTRLEARAAAPIRIAFVQSCWHKEIVDQAREAFEEAMRD